MAWRQLILEAQQADQEALEEALWQAGACAISLEDAADQPLLEPVPGELPRWQQARLVALFRLDDPPEAILARLDQARGRQPLPTHRFEMLADQDWQRVWLDSYHPMRFGARLWVCPSHRQPPEPDAINVILDPGLAFGTGTHETTTLCLGWLAELPLEEATVIDYGCGSGILGIAAALLGAHRVYATDIDPQALVATLDNARRNHIEERLWVDFPVVLPPLEADVLIANILARPLIELAPRFAQNVKPMGRIALAGLLRMQAAEVIAAYAPWFALDIHAHQDDWVLLTGIRHA